MTKLTDGRRPQQRLVRLLDADPDLADDLSPADLAEARDRLIVPEGLLPPGRWTPPMDGNRTLVLLEGLITKHTTVAGECSAQLIGPGDVFRASHGFDVSSVTTSWAVHQTARVLLIDASVLGGMQRWPTLVGALLQRTADQLDFAAAQIAAGMVRGIEGRLLALLRLYAERWGRVTPDGVLVPWPLGHELLAQLVGARRPTVTMGLSRLSVRGAVTRRPDRTWLIRELALPVVADDVRLAVPV